MREIAVVFLLAFGLVFGGVSVEPVSAVEQIAMDKPSKPKPLPLPFPPYPL